MTSVALLLGSAAANAQGAPGAYRFSPEQPTSVDEITLSLTLLDPPLPGQCIGLKLTSVALPEHQVELTMDYACSAGQDAGLIRSARIGRLPAGSYVVLVHSGLDFGTPPPPARMTLVVGDPAVPALSEAVLPLLGILMVLVAAVGGRGRGCVRTPTQ